MYSYTHQAILDYLVILLKKMKEMLRKIKNVLDITVKMLLSKLFSYLFSSYISKADVYSKKLGFFNCKFIPEVNVPRFLYITIQKQVLQTRRVIIKIFGF